MWRGCRAKANIWLAEGLLADSRLLLLLLITIIDFHSRVIDSVMAARLVGESFSGATLGVLASVLLLGGLLELGEARVGVFGQDEGGIVGKGSLFLR